MTIHFQQFIKTIFIGAIILLFASVLIRIWIIYRYGSVLYSPDNSPSAPVAVIFGAGLRRDGKPTKVLQDRIQTGIDLYKFGKVDVLLMSGSQTFTGYDEVMSMRDYAIANGVPANAIQLDGRGFSTSNTCENILANRLERVLLVTQNFHLPRALFYCTSLGIESIGVSADTPGYRRTTIALWNIREIPATFVAFLQILSKMKIP